MVREKGKAERVVLVDRRGNGKGASPHKLAAWTPNVSLALIQQGRESTDEDDYSSFFGTQSPPEQKVFVYDASLKEAVFIDEGWIKSAGVFGRDTLGFIASKSRPHDTNTRVTSLDTLYIYTSGSRKPTVTLPWISGEAMALASAPRSQLAVNHLTKDEYGALGNYSLEIVDARRHTVKHLAKCRLHDPEFMWLDSHTIAYSITDKFQVPGLYVADVTTGKSRLLYSNPRFGALKPVGYWKQGKMILFQTSPDPLVRLPYHDTLWSLSPNGRATKLATLWEQPKSERNDR